LLGLVLLKRASRNEQHLEGAAFLVRRSRREILIRGSENPLVPVEIARAEQRGSRPEQQKQQAGARANKKADRRRDRDRLALREFQFPE
jgi:hypothetical protein